MTGGETQEEEEGEEEMMKQHCGEQCEKFLQSVFKAGRVTSPGICFSFSLKVKGHGS